eukprot:1308283-Pyramimonas_sp.AAC.2
MATCTSLTRGLATRQCEAASTASCTAACERNRLAGRGYKSTPTVSLTGRNSLGSYVKGWRSSVC